MHIAHVNAKDPTRVYECMYLSGIVVASKEKDKAGRPGFSCKWMIIIDKDCDVKRDHHHHHDGHRPVVVERETPGVKKMKQRPPPIYWRTNCDEIAI